MVNITQPRESRKSNWESVVFAAVFFLHATLIAYGFQWQKDFRSNTLLEDEALQVSFIDRMVVSEPEPSDPSGKQNKTIVSTVFKENVPVLAERDAVRDSHVLRLTMDVDEWQAPTAIAPRDPLKRQFIALPGRTEPFIHGIKLTDRLTPEQRLKMVGKLFGAVDHDPCKEARRRMASGQSQVNAIDVELDLRNIELHCRP